MSIPNIQNGLINKLRDTRKIRFMINFLLKEKELEKMRVKVVIIQP
jgi:hypothetical protein